MTLLYFDGFESYANASDMADSGWVNYNSPTITTDKKTGERALTMYNRNIYTRYMFGVNAANDTCIIGFAYKWTEANGMDQYDRLMLAFLDPAASAHSGVCITNLGAITVYRGSTLLGTTAIDTVRVAAWDFYEFKLYAHQTAGTFDIKKNGVNILSLNGDGSGIDTTDLANTNIAGFQLKGTGDNFTPANMRVDDLYALDTGSSAPCNDYLGEIRIDPLRPIGNGYHTDFTPLSGSNWENVDEDTPDDNASYNETGITNHKDTYEIQNLLYNGGTIYGVKISATACKTDVGSKVVRPIARINSTDYNGDAFALSTDYLTGQKVWEVNPDDSAAFEDADVNAMEIGIEVTV